MFLDNLEMNIFSENCTKTRPPSVFLFYQIFTEYSNLFSAVCLHLATCIFHSYSTKNAMFPILSISDVRLFCSSVYFLYLPCSTSIFSLLYHQISFCYCINLYGSFNFVTSASGSNLQIIDTRGFSVVHILLSHANGCL